jgi:hypothetical protein
VKPGIISTQSRFTSDDAVITWWSSGSVSDTIWKMSGARVIRKTPQRNAGFRVRWDDVGASGIGAILPE